jgi:hypothetical protein
MSQLVAPWHLQLKYLGAQWVTVGSEFYNVHGEVEGRRGVYVATPMRGCEVYLVSGQSVELFDPSATDRAHTTPLRFVTAEEVVRAVAYTHLERPDEYVGVNAMEAARAHLATGLADPVDFRKQLAELLRREPDELRTAELRSTLLAEAEAAAEERLRKPTSHENAGYAVALLVAARLARYVCDEGR